jgi:hypothetical protein
VPGALRCPKISVICEVIGCTIAHQKSGVVFRLEFFDDPVLYVPGLLRTEKG